MGIKTSATMSLYRAASIQGPLLRTYQTGLTYEAVVHHALVRYTSSGAEALLAIEPLALCELISARKAGDWAKVGAIIDWLEAGLESPHWR